MLPQALIEKAIAKGTDAEYQAWVRQFPSCLSQTYSEFLHGEGRCEYSHVRRVSHGSGAAYKPEYSGVPLTHEEHQLQHQKGEQVFCSPEWFERQAMKYLTMWINGINPPEIEEYKSNWKKEYNIEYAGQLLAIQLLLQKHFSKKDAPHIKCTIQPATKKRSKKQNNAQWSVLYDNALEYYKNNMGDLALDTLKAIKFGVDKNFMHWMFKQLFLDGGSTAQLDTMESKEYAETIRHYFLHKYQHIIPEPDKYYNLYNNNI